MTLEELKLRRLANQFLIQPSDKLTAVRALCGVQAVRSALKARKSGKCSGCGGDCAACPHKEK